MYGAAWAVLVSYILMAVLLHEISRRVYPIKYEYARLLKIFLIVIIFGGFGLYCQGAYRDIIILKSLILVLYPVTFWFSGFFYVSEKVRIKKILIGNFVD